MTTHEDDHDPEPPEVTAALHEAQDMVKRVAGVLQAQGWDAIVISLTRLVVVGPDDYRAPGATATIIDKHRVGPAARQLAEVLRKQADLLAASAPPDDASASGYIQDQTNYASGMAKWPR